VIETSDRKQAIEISSSKTPTKKSEDRKTNIRDYLNNHGASTSKEIADYVGISSDRARVYLQEFVSEGIAVAEGENRYRTYRLKTKK